MQKNPLRFLGLLGLLGLVGLITGNAGFYGFFGFFGFFGLARETDDEMLRHNLARAGLNAFIVSLVGVSLAIAIVSLTKSPEAAAVCIAVIFIAQISTFVISFNLYEKRGDLK